MKSTTRRVAALLLGLSLLGGALTMTSCAQKTTPIATLEDYEISVNMYRFFLSRIKGTLGRTGYSVDSAAFWDTVASSDGSTYDDYFRQAALTDTRRYLAALTLFDEMELTLPKATVEKIDEELEEYIRDAGSKSALNSELGQFGVNIDMLREIYVIEAKFKYLQESIYGAGGSKIAAQVYQEYLEKNAVCFRHLLIRAFDYVYETDTNGDDIYFLPNENNAKVNNIAYDKEAGTTRVDEYGEAIKDKNGELVYFLPSGKIAYDTEAGVRAIVYDADGIAKTVKYSAETLAEHKAAGEEIVASVAAGDYAAFEALLAEYEIADDEAFITDDSYAFLFTSGDNDYDYLNDIADVLAESELGTVHMVSSEYGYNVVMKYPIPSDAASNQDYKDWFGDLSDRVIADLFHNKCSPYMDKVVVDEAEFSKLPSMKEVGINYYY